MQASIPRIRLVGSGEEQFFAIFVNSCTLDEWTLFVNFGSETPGMECLKKSGLDTIRTASN